MTRKDLLLEVYPTSKVGHTVDLFPENIPEELKRRPQWVNWKSERRGDKRTKVPHSPRTGGRAKSTDLATWSTFEEAVQALQGGRYDGLGFVFCTGDPYTGIDLDGCRDPETGKLEPWAAKIVCELNGYAEASPSGRGVHVIVRGKAPNGRRGQLEIYSSERYFTMTGRIL